MKILHNVLNHQEDFFYLKRAYFTQKKPILTTILSIKYSSVLLACDKYCASDTAIWSTTNQYFIKLT